MYVRENVRMKGQKERWYASERACMRQRNCLIYASEKLSHLCVRGIASFMVQVWAERTIEMIWTRVANFDSG